MSFFGGLTNRFAYVPSRWVIVRDVVAAALENNLILLGLESTAATSQLPVRHKPNRNKQMRGRRSSHSGYGMMRTTRLVVHRSLVGALCVTWVIASWGDYVFESESRGLIPTMWVIAPGLKDPTVHAGVQMRNHRDVFIGGLIRCLVGLCIGLGYAWIVHSSFCSSASATNRASPYFKDRQKNTRYISVNNLRDLFNALKTPRLLGCNIVALLTLFLFGAWAPLTNLTYCMFGIFLLTPPGGAVGKSEVTLPTVRGPSSNIRSKQQQGRTTPPNVIVIVQESLSGAAMQSTRGIDAAPFFHSMRSNPNFYDFRFARTTAGTTPIATPSLLTGLMPFDDDGVELVKRASLASDFKRLGYDTSCFAAYGADWTGNAWEILSYMLMPGFDAIFDPKATGDALVNEYGMDDRVMSKHFVQWLKTRRAPGNVTTSDANERSDEVSNNATIGAVPGGNRENRKRTRNQIEQNQRRKQKQRPFFSLMVQNNNHFPHLMHETYSGDPDCEREKDDIGSNSNITSVKFGEIDSNADLGLDSYEENFGWNEDYGGASCGFSDVSRYFSSIRTIDEALEIIFEELDASGQLNNTIIMGAGDHGEVPGVLERMSDVNAPLLSIPLWMYIPEHLLPDRAYMSAEKARQKRRRSTDDTHLRANVGNGVSILDVVPTLRDLIGFDEIYSSEEIDKCVVGQSLLSQQSSDKRIMMSWQGLPLQGHQIGIFSTASDALLYYKKDSSQTKQVDYLFPSEDIFFSRSEHPLNEEPAIGQKWKLRLEEEGLLDHAAVKKWMPNLKHILDKPTAKTMDMTKTMDENVESDEPGNGE